MEDEGEGIQVGPGGVRVWVHHDPDEAIGERRVRRGRVDAIERAEDTWQIRVLDAQETPRRLAVSLPEGLALPFGLGDVIAAEVVVRMEMPSPTTDGQVLDARGRLLVADVQSGSQELLSDVALTLGEIIREIAPPRPEMAKGLERALWVSHEGRSLRLAGRGWRRLPLDEGALVASGHAWGWEPGRPIPPDARDGWRLSVVRVR